MVNYEYESTEFETRERLGGLLTLEQKGIHHKTGAKGVREGVIVCGAVWWM